MRHAMTALPLVFCLLGTPIAVLADDHEPESSAHPLEVIGTLLYPVGWLVDTVVVRPLHWVAHLGPVSTVTGHETDRAPEVDDE
jgi:hypothetical protein